MHTVRGLQSASLKGVGATAWYWELEHTVTGEQTRLEVVVGAVDWVVAG